MQQQEIIRQTKNAFQEIHSLNDHRGKWMETLNQAVHSLQGSCQVLQEELLKKDAELQEVRKINSKNAAEIVFFKEQVEILKTSLRELTGDTSGYREQQSDMSRQMEVLQAELGELKSSVAAISQDVQEMPTRTEVDAELNNLQSQIMDSIDQAWQVESGVPASLPVVGLINPTFSQNEEDADPTGVNLHAVPHSMSSLLAGPSVSAPFSVSMGVFSVCPVIPPVVPATSSLRYTRMDSRLGTPMSDVDFLHVNPQNMAVSMGIGVGQMPKGVKLASPPRFNEKQEVLTWIKTLELHFQLAVIREAPQQILLGMSLMDNGPALWATAEYN